MAVSVTYEPVECKFGVYLIAELYRYGAICAHTQHELPCTHVKEAVEKSAVLTEDMYHIYSNGKGFSYTFSKHYGVFTSMIVDGEEQLEGKTVSSAFRAPTDNERNVKVRWANINIWQGGIWIVPSQKYTSAVLRIIGLY